MEFFALAALSVPLSAWGISRVYTSLFDDNSHTTLSSYLLPLGLAILVVKLNLLLINKYRFDRRAWALGCGRVAVYPHKDPILGLDSFIEAIRALNSHKLLDFYASRLASCGATHYSITLGSWVLMTCEVENIKTILGPKMEDWPIAGPRLLASLPVLGPDSIFTTNGQAWHKARAMLRPSFVRDQVADLKCFDRHIRNMLAAIPADGTTFDIQNLLLDMTMDSSTDFLLGYSTNSLTAPSPEAQQFVKDFEFASREGAKKARLGPVLYYLPHRELRDAVCGMREYVRSYLEKVAAQSEKGEVKERSYVFLDEILKANPPVDYTIDQILSILVAGRDTTAAAMTAAFYFLARNPIMVEKLRKEILAVDEEYPTWEQLKEMKYLNNVVKEGMPLSVSAEIHTPTNTPHSPAPLYPRIHKLQNHQQGNHPTPWRRQGWQTTHSRAQGHISAVVGPCAAPE